MATQQVLKPVVLAVVASASRPGVEYEVRQSMKDGVVYCTCPAWRFGKGKACKHMVAALGAAAFAQKAA